MCGRYQFSEDSSATLAQIMRELGCTEFAGEIFPSAAAPVLKAEGGAVRPALLDWGFPIQGKRLVINARAETAAVKPLFRDSLNARRCVIPSSGTRKNANTSSGFLTLTPCIWLGFMTCAKAGRVSASSQLRPTIP